MAGVHLNPIERVRRYCKYLLQDVAVFHDHRDAVHGVAFLHNAKQSEGQRPSEMPVRPA
jgi:uncharacterized protein